MKKPEKKYIQRLNEDFASSPTVRKYERKRGYNQGIKDYEKFLPSLEEIKEETYPYVAGVFGYCLARANMDGDMEMTDRDKKFVDGTNEELATVIHKRITNG